MNIIYALCLLTWMPFASALPWPVLNELAIRSCDNTVTRPCATNVFYESTGTHWTDVQPVVPPPTELTITAYGVGCRNGDAVSGFRDCVWARDPYAPRVFKCKLVGDGSWRLTADSSCTSNLAWGPNGGVSPGSACIVFGAPLDGIGGARYNSILTPMGAVSALQAANGGNRFCVKALPPNTRCEVNLGSAILDHGVMGTYASSVRSLSGSVDCGDAPLITIVGGNDLILGAGVKTRLSTMMVGNRTINISSELTTSGAAPSSYMASTVLVVSPW